MVSPKHPRGFNPNHPTHPKLDGAERQRHIRLWHKQLADEHNRLKTEEHVRELLRERFGAGSDDLAAAELKAAAAGPSFASEIGAEDRPGSPRKPSMGFAYGGVFPGTIHAHGQLVKQHSVSFSVGRAGTYFLHVGLRSTSLPLPGSPFQLTVWPGRAHALSTRIPTASLPLRTTVGETGKLVVHAADRMGNLCHKGGDPLKALESSGRVTCSTIDLGDGRYEFSWHAEIAGTYLLQLAIAGSNIYGSPSELTMLPAAPSVPRCEVAGTGLHRALAGRYAHLRITSKDRFSNVTLPGQSMSFGMCIIPAVLGVEGKTSGTPASSSEGTSKPLYTDEQIYGVTKAAAMERARKIEEEKKQAQLEKMREVEKPSPEVTTAEVEEKEAQKGKESNKIGGRRESVKATQAPAPAPAPPQQPARRESIKPNDKEDKKAKQKAERRAAVEAEAAATAAKKAEKKAEEARAAAEKAAAARAKPATVKSLDFEGAWRPNGEFEIRYVAKEAGNFALHIWCDLEGNGERHRLPGSPFHLFVSASSPSARGSTIVGLEKRSYSAGEMLEFKPQLRDAFGNPTELIDRQPTNMAQGSMAASIMKELFAQHGALVKASRPAFDGDDNAEYGTPKLFGGGKGVAQQKKRRNLLGTPFPAAKKEPAHELTAWLVSPKGTTPLVLTKVAAELGLYCIDSHVVTVSGQYDAHVALNGVEISGSPFTFGVVPAEGHGRMSYVSGPEAPAFAKLPYELTLHSVDRFGNKLRTGGAKVEGKIIGANASACTVVDHKDGTYSLHFTVHTTGSYNVEVRIDGNKVKGSPGASASFQEAEQADRKAAKRAKARLEKKRRDEEAAKREASESVAQAAANLTESLAPVPADAASTAATRPGSGRAGQGGKKVDRLPTESSSSVKGPAKVLSEDLPLGGGLKGTAASRQVPMGFAARATASGDEVSDLTATL